MSRKLYLIRHGSVKFEDDIKRCIGRTDLPLSEKGRKEAKELGKYFKNIPYEAVYSSPLSRAMQTASFISKDIRVKENLVEMDMGEWENLPLKSIHKTLESEPLYGEKRVDAVNRFMKCIEEIKEETTKDVIVVAHAGVNCAYLSQLLHQPLETSRAITQPYGGISIINLDHESVIKLGIKPQQQPDDEDIRNLYDRYHTPANVIAHCEAVCEIAEELAKNKKVDHDLVHAAALLHDLMRTSDDHAKKAAEIMIKEGYPILSEIIAHHHDCTLDDRKETMIVYLADKYADGIHRVSIAQRFEKSKGKCKDEEAREAHERRYQQALAIERWIRKEE